MEIKANDGEAIDNDLIYGKSHGLKKDEAGNTFGGSGISLFKADCSEFAAENVIRTATSAEDGSFSFAGVPYENWLLREVEAPIIRYLLCVSCCPPVYYEVLDTHNALAGFGGDEPVKLGVFGELIDKQDERNTT